MKLYKLRVEIEFDMCVAAEDEDDAKKIADQNLTKELNTWAMEHIASIGNPSMVKSRADIPEDWIDSNSYIGKNKYANKECIDWFPP